MTFTISREAAQWQVHGEHGISSEAIFDRLTFGETNTRWRPRNYPLDVSDFRRCESLLRQVPGLRADLWKMASEHPVWAALIKRWDELVALMEEEIPDCFDPAARRTGSAPRAYELMRQIEDSADV